MGTLKNRIVELLAHEPGLSDREITNRLTGVGTPQQPVNQACRSLAEKGVIRRRKRSDGLIGNYLRTTNPSEYRQQPRATTQEDDALSEDNIKAVLKEWLVNQGWDVSVAWGRTQGIDMEAFRENDRWIIEVKGRGSRSAMRVNYFLGVLGETLQRMNDPNARYSIALPDLPQYRSLWERLPSLAKKRTGISALFVDRHGKVTLSDAV